MADDDFNCLLDDELVKEFAEVLPMARAEAEAGNLKTQLWLAEVYTAGIFVGLNIDEAKKWLLMAAEQGHAEAYYRIGDMCMSYYCMLEAEEAFGWYVKAAEQGYTKANLQLSFMYMYGHGVEIDETEAFNWSMKAAELGDRDAMYDVAGRLSWWSDDPNDMYEAVSWHKKAAQKGHVGSLYELAVIYLYEGGKIPHDYELSYAYASAGADKGNTGALNVKTELVSKMTPEQITKAKKLAAELLAKDKESCE